MASIKSKANKDTELYMMAILRANRIRGWRRNSKLLGRPDFVFYDHRVVVFVDGCFWHGCHMHGNRPATNVEFWEKKFIRNKARDRHVTMELRKQGWSVIRIWEHSLKRPAKIVRRLKRALGQGVHS